MLREGAGLYRYFLRKVKELQEILDTEKLPPSEQAEILRTKDYMQKMVQKYQPMYREYMEANMVECLDHSEFMGIPFSSHD